ncbi:MAG TPA: DUF952 domain-containing protein [Caulobacteraceae bacterium]|jgi:uncharacterized protein (DUF952 family)|nr:DUF952 domain-containing protein [Caulobacteraceae bacterium]
MSRIYKILSKGDWTAALKTGAYLGSADDRRDGFIHLSGADQTAETARKYFTGRDDLVLAVFEAESLGPGLVWEPSRGGALFPHLYGPLPITQAVEVRPLALDAAGVPDPGPLSP